MDFAPFILANIIDIRPLVSGGEGVRIISGFFKKRPIINEEKCQ